MIICVADDEQEVRESIINKLKSLFPHADIYDVEFGVRALENLQIVRPDLAFLDIRMPEMDGLDILEKIKQSHPTMQAVILSGYDDFEYARKALQRGALNYLLKPADRDELREVVISVQAQMEQRCLKQLKPHLDKLRAEQTCVQVVRCYNTSLWFDERKIKQVWIGDDAEIPVSLSCERDVLLEFVVNRAGRGFIAIVREGTHNHYTFAERKDVIKAMSAAIEAWETRQFFGGPRDRSPGEESKAKQEAARQRERVLQAAQNLRVDELRVALDAWLACLGTMGLKALKTECVYLMASLDEGLVRSNVMFLQEDKKQYWWQWVSKHQTWDELAASLRKFIVDGIKALKEVDKQDGDHWFMQALNWIERSKDPNLSLERAAEQFGVHPVTLSRLFKQHTGMNFVNYMARQKLINAQTLLRSTDKKINEIAEEVGYADYRYFRMLFKREFGLTPSEYRSRHRMTPNPDE